MRRVIALAGRPNTGKTTLFNALTGMRQRVANFAGCTVEKAVGAATLEGSECEVVDLPGTHSLLPATEDEKVAFRFLSECAEAGTNLLVLCVAEASNLSNDAALAAGLKAAGYPVVLVVNMIDEARLNGLRVDAEALSRSLGLPVALASARNGEGMPAVLRLLRPASVRADLSKAMDFRRTAGHLLQDLQERAVHAADRAGARAVTLPKQALLTTIDRSIRIDRVLLHPLAGPFILGSVMFFLFQALFAWAHPLMDLLSWGLATLSEALRARLPAGHFSSLLCDGALPGVAAVVVFVPQIAILFAMIGALEQSGYLPRAGAMVDRALRPFGLDGKIFIPFLSSFACAIPGVMATRTIADERRRLVAILLSPLMTCSARLPVYTIIITAFVPATFRPWGWDGRGVVMAAMYLVGVIVALALAFLLKWTRLHAPHPPAATVLPPYRVPRPQELFRYVRSRVWHFLSRAGQVIFLVSLLLWALASFPNNGKDLEGLPPERAAALRIQGSALGMAGRAIEPVFRPLGWDWRISVAVLSSLAAREVFVGTLGTIYAMGHETHGSEGLVRALQEAKKEDGTPRYGVPMAAGLLLFFAVAIQCMSTIAIVRRETGGWKWPAIQFSVFFALAYGLAWTVVCVLQ